ncbi:MMB_0454 family protein [Mycoplasma procyoni]|uniref:MMB_0454 family protein n=1 Tax=Mycoplasma procyoni TaxID=568784 RepID=UPI00197BD7E4|nr:hypothetical protein [Mycoplasma procyoni]MBN3534602.1 hypothetical protein [Mycoplasma procyoni]
MEYVIVNYGLNQVYSIHKNAFAQTIKAVFVKNRDVKLDGDIEVVINNTNTNVSVDLAFYVFETNQDFSDVVNNLLNSLKEAIKFLIGVEAENMTLQYKGKIKK